MKHFKSDHGDFKTERKRNTEENQSLFNDLRPKLPWAPVVFYHARREFSVSAEGHQIVEKSLAPRLDLNVHQTH